MKRKTKIGKTYNLLIQLAILVLTYGFIFKQVFYRKDIPRIWESLLSRFSEAEFLAGLIMVIVMMGLNWGIETGKWRFLMSTIERIGFRRAFQAVLTGITISSFTPNRVGEYFGRVFSLSTGNRIEGILITILGSMAQLLVTIFTGSIALLVFIPLFFNHYMGYFNYLYYLMFAVVTGLNILLIALFLNVRFLSAWKEWFFRKRLRKIRKFFRVFGYYSQRSLLWVLVLSSFRYMVFSTQFYLLLQVFGVTLPYFDALMLISLIYFVMTVIPTVALTELGIRGSVAIYFFGLYFGGNPPDIEEISFGVLAATMVLWVINLGIPALIGSFFVFRLTFFRKPNPTNP